jgi:16S rRNA G966 N2-methylase RsmD
LIRFEKFCKGKTETNKFKNINEIKIYNQSSEKLGFIKNNSIDYIFTDPPYGQSISYFGLSMFWNAWLNKKVNYKNEIIYDQYRDKKYEDYEERIKKVFAEIYRVLKFDKYLSLTFHNRDIRIWEIIIKNLKLIGFKLENICYQEQAVASGTQGLNKKNTFKGDFVYNFIKKKIVKNINIRPKKIQNVEEKIVKKINQLLRNNNNRLSPDKLYEKIIPYIVNNNFYKDKNGKTTDVENILNKFFLFKKITNSNRDEYVWVKN